MNREAWAEVHPLPAFAEREEHLRQRASRLWNEDEDVAVCLVEIDRLRAAGTLDAAWQAAEAALPEGWTFGSLSSYAYEGKQWYATAGIGTLAGSEVVEGEGDTPTAALLALAEKLAQR